MITLDEFGEAVNSQDTYDFIANILWVDCNSIIIGWTDGEGSHYDILFTLGAETNNENRKTIQGGLKPATDLFVSVMRKGAFAFEINNRWTSPQYFAEKLTLGGAGSTAEKLAELINGIKYAVYKLQGN